MKDLERALADITAIRSQMARGTQFRGYGPVTVAATGLLALLAAALQALYRARSGRGAARLISCSGPAWRRSPCCSPAPR